MRSAPRTPSHDHHYHPSINVSTYQIPIVEKKTLITILEKQGIELSSNFFECLNKHEVQKFLDDIIYLVFGIHVTFHDTKSLQIEIESNSKRIGKKAPHMDECLPDFGARHVQGITARQTHKYLCRFGDLFGIPDVSIEDVAHPTAQRLQLFGSAIVDLIRFQQQELSDELHLWNDVAEKGEQIKNKRFERDEFIAATQAFKERLTQEQTEVFKLEQKVEQMETTICSRNVEFIKKAETLKDVEATHHELEQKITSRHEKLKDLKSAIKEAKEQIVDSPRRIVETLQTLTAKAEAERMTTKAEEEQRPLQQMYLNIIECIKERSDQAEKLLNERQIAIDDKDATLKTYEEQKKYLNALERQCNEQILKEKNLRKTLEITQSELEIARSECEAIKNSCMEERKVKMIEKSKEREERESIEKSIEECNHQIMRLESFCNQIRDEGVEKIMRSEYLYEQMKKDWNEEYEAVQRRLEMIIEKAVTSIDDAFVSSIVTNALERHPYFSAIQALSTDELAIPFIKDKLFLNSSENETSPIISLNHYSSVSEGGSPILSMPSYPSYLPDFIIPSKDTMDKSEFKSCSPATRPISSFNSHISALEKRLEQKREALLRNRKTQIKGPTSESTQQPDIESSVLDNHRTSSEPQNTNTVNARSRSVDIKLSQSSDKSPNRPSSSPTTLLHSSASRIDGTSKRTKVGSLATFMTATKSPNVSSELNNMKLQLRSGDSVGRQRRNRSYHHSSKSPPNQLKSPQLNHKSLQHQKTQKSSNIALEKTNNNGNIQVLRADRSTTLPSPQSIKKNDENKPPKSKSSFRVSEDYNRFDVNKKVVKDKNYSGRRLNQSRGPSMVFGP